MSKRRLWFVALASSVVLLLGLMTGLSLAQGPAPEQAEGAQAALGTAFTYQGRLTDNGSPADGTYDFQFTLYDAATGGNVVGSAVTLDNISVSDGLFTVQLDFGANAFDGNARWLEIAVRPGSSTGSYTSLAPRQPLSAVPYALYSTSAPWSGLTGVPAGFADGVDNDTTYSPGTGLTLSGGVFSLATSYRLPQGCANGQIAKWNGSEWACAADADSGGDITGVTAGTGLTGGGTSGDVTLSLDTNYTDDRYWKIGGNAGTSPYTSAIGTLDEVPLFVIVSDTVALSLTPVSGTVNIVGGLGDVAPLVMGATIGGGGSYKYCDLYSGTPCFNQVYADYGTVAGGEGNQAGQHAFVGGGYYNRAWGTYATIPGGSLNSAMANSTFAAGHRANAKHAGAFVWGDSTGADINSPAQNTFIVRANGGVWFGRSTSNFTPTIGSGVFISTSTGAHLTLGGTWVNASDRNAKENFQAVDPQAVLEKVAQLPITTWKYKVEDDDVRHMGPTAQDFYAAFELGTSDTSIATVDADGVALAAIQGLYQQNQELAARVAQLEAQNAALEARLDALERGRGWARTSGMAPWVLLGFLGLVVLVRRRQEEQ